MKKLSVVISAKNEAAKITRTLESVSWADEIIVIDSGSEDGTGEIAGRMGARVYRRPNDLMLNRNKNFGFTKATGRWILNLDADEVVPPELAAEIRSVIDTPDSGDLKQPAGYWLKRKNISFGKWIQHGLWWPDRQLRLFLRGKGQFPEKHIHEYIAVDGITAGLVEPYLHYNYETISQFLTKLDRCTTSEAGYLRESSYRFAWTDALKFPVSDFVKIYFAQKGYKDGLHGLILAMLQAFYSFVTYAKYWEHRGFPQVDLQTGEINRHLAEEAGIMRHWMYESAIAETASPLFRFLLRVRRKLSVMIGKIAR